MYYLYNIESYAQHPYEYYKESELQDVILKSFEDLDDLNQFLESDDGGDWWPIHESYTASHIPVNCVDKEDALKHLLDSLNLDVYETINNL